MDHKKALQATLVNLTWGEGAHEKSGGHFGSIAQFTNRINLLMALCVGGNAATWFFLEQSYDLFPSKHKKKN